MTGRQKITSRHLDYRIPLKVTSRPSSLPTVYAKRPTSSFEQQHYAFYVAQSANSRLRISNSCPVNVI